MTTRDRLITIIEAWSDDPLDESLEQWDSILKVNVLIQTEKEFGVRFNSAEIPAITGLETLLAWLERNIEKPAEQPAEQQTVMSKKVLVLDCDGVLWNGTAGEGGIVFSLDSIEFQKQVSRLEQAGVLVCLCSKNNPADVQGIFADVAWISIGWTQIVASEIGWDPKPEGLKRLAKRLNLGLDSFVFIDDSPHERAEVQAALPEVTVLAPEEPFAHLFTELPGKSLTESYRLRQTVQEAMDSAVNRQAFLDGLDMVATLRINDESLIPRMAELSQKTNQFNMTLMRMTELELLRRLFRPSAANFAFCASLKDRFGDAGWVAMAVIEFREHAFWLDDFCVSCRVLGRGFERAFVEKCLEFIPGRDQFPLKTYYMAGPRNQVCGKFFDADGKVSETVPRAPVRWED